MTAIKPTESPTKYLQWMGRARRRKTVPPVQAAQHKEPLWPTDYLDLSQTAVDALNNKGENDVNT